MTTSRVRRLLWLWPVVLASAVGMTYWHYRMCIQRLDMASTSYRSCQQLAVEISEARQAPQHAQLETRSLDDLGSSIEKAATKAQLERDRVLRIDPQPGKRLGKTDYLEQATEVELVNVTLQQLVEFLFNVAESGEQLQVHTIRLRTPHSPDASGGDELWLADAVLTQRVYAPTTPRHE
jgi:hypothetical protein